MNNNDDNNQQQIPPGYRFYPTEEELVSFYLGNKLANVRAREIEQVIPAVNLYRLDPWQLVSFSSIGEDSEQWFFFCPQQEREAHGGKPARTTPSGYWKATGSPGPVYSSTNKLIGVKKSMVFYEGKAPRGSKTKWKMNEYRALDDTTTSGEGSPKFRTEYTLCRVYKNSGCMRAFDRRPFVDAATVPDRSSLGLERERERSQVSSLDGHNDDSSFVEELTEDIKLLQEMDWENWL